MAMHHTSDKTINIIYLLAAMVFLLVILCYRRKIIERIQRSYYGWFLPGPPALIPFIYNGIEFLNKTTAGILFYQLLLIKMKIKTKIKMEQELNETSKEIMKVHEFIVTNRNNLFRLHFVD